jgi:hypothetical protein
MRLAVVRVSPGDRSSAFRIRYGNRFHFDRTHGAGIPHQRGQDGREGPVCRPGHVRCVSADRGAGCRNRGRDRRDGGRRGHMIGLSVGPDEEGVPPPLYDGADAGPAVDGDEIVL